MSSGSRAEHDEAFEQYQKWLEDRGVIVADCLTLRSPSRKGDRKDKIPEALRKEWGIMSLNQTIPKGTEICSVPKRACFMGDKSLSAHVSESDDSQLHLAVSLLKALAAGPAGPDWPKVQTLPSSVGVCWAWPENERSWLQGTEVEEVIIRKLRRLREEHALAQSKGIECSFEAYFDACTVVISHANPWFGVCMVPFVDMGNHSDRPDVEFRHRGSSIVGKAIRSIAPWKEIYQSYGELGVADMLYRYGFARIGSDALDPRSDDVASIYAQHITSSIGGSGAAQPSSDASAGSRIARLLQAGVLGESPWSGMDDVISIQLSLPSKSKVDGLAELLVAVYSLLLPDDAWAAVLRGADASRAALAGRAAADDAEMLSLYVSIEARETGQSLAHVTERLSPTIASLAQPPPGKRKAGAAAAGASGARPPGGDAAGGGGDEEDADGASGDSGDSGDSDSDSADGSGLEWAGLVGRCGERAPWARAPPVIAAARRVLRDRDARYPDDAAPARTPPGETSEGGGAGAAAADDAAADRRRREAEEFHSAAKRGAAGRNRAMALQLRTVERTILAAAAAALDRVTAPS